MRSRRGWVFIDVVMGVILVGMIAGMLGAAAGWHYRALKHLADTRAATRLAESTLISLQTGQPVAAADSKCRELSAATDLPGMTWVEVSATVDGRSASLVGLVPNNSLTPAGGS